MCDAFRARRKKAELVFSSKYTKKSVKKAKKTLNKKSKSKAKAKGKQAKNTPTKTTPAKKVVATNSLSKKVKLIVIDILVFFLICQTWFKKIVFTKFVILCKNYPFKIR